jgi:hypothetical protein
MAIWRGESAGEISPVEDPVVIVRSEQVEVAVPGFWPQRASAVMTFAAFCTLPT